jgi:hypothetical protein
MKGKTSINKNRGEQLAYITLALALLGIIILGAALWGLWYGWEQLIWLLMCMISFPLPFLALLTGIGSIDRSNDKGSKLIAGFGILISLICEFIYLIMICRVIFGFAQII